MKRLKKQAQNSINAHSLHFDLNKSITKSHFMKLGKFEYRMTIKCCLDIIVTFMVDFLLPSET